MVTEELASNSKIDLAAKASSFICALLLGLLTYQAQDLMGLSESNELRITGLENWRSARDADRVTIQDTSQQATTLAEVVANLSAVSSQVAGMNQRQIEMSREIQMIREAIARQGIALQEREPGK